MVLRVWLLLVMWVFFVACSNPPPPTAVEKLRSRARTTPVTLRLSDELSLEQRALVFSGAEELRIASGGALQTHFIGVGAELFVGLSDKVDLGKYQPRESIMLRRGLIAGELFRAVTMHELAHSFGVPHLEDGLMRATIGPNDNCIDGLTLSVVCAVYQCFGREKATCR